ncbi:MAG TPA: KH domain-containing protein [Patescibacteria group bacterium]|nr:KH domain-containing protein [Patescibacteria group bacterium]
MKELLELIARSFVDKPDEVSVAEIDEGDAIVFELIVAQDELGKVIGRQGRTAKAMRTILGAAGLKMGRRFVLEILE